MYRTGRLERGVENLYRRISELQKSHSSQKKDHEKDMMIEISIFAIYR